MYDLEVPDHHNFVAGGMLAHNTSALLAFYLNDIETRDTAPIVIDPKSELSHICLRATPPDCAKRVWFLDLGRPAFGMNPLRLSGDRPLPVEAGAIAANIVAALLDINENQIFMSSRRYLNHAVIGAIALAHQQNRRAKFEDVYTLLLPAEQDFRQQVAAACADPPDLDQTAAFYRYELPDELNRAGSATTQRLDAPRNKAEIYFSIVQRKVLTPNDFADLDTLERQLLAFGRRYEQIATPFEWKFTRADLDRLAQRLDLTVARAA